MERSTVQSCLAAPVLPSKQSFARLAGASTCTHSFVSLSPTPLAPAVQLPLVARLPAAFYWHPAKPKGAGSTAVTKRSAREHALPSWAAGDGNPQQKRD